MEVRTRVHAGLFRISLDYSKASRNNVTVVLRHASIIAQSGLPFLLCEPVVPGHYP